MSSKPKLCIVCLKTDSELINASQTDNNNVNWTCKLQFCVPEVEWTESCSICSACTEQLDAACAFRNLCLQSNESQIKLDQNLGLKLKKTTTSKINSKHKSDFTCYICSKSFQIKSTLIKHIKTHSINRCDLCKEQFTTSTQLQLHNVRMHSEKKDLINECRFCSRAFKSHISLNQHIKRMHRKDYDFNNTTESNIEAVDVKNDVKVEEAYGEDAMENVGAILEDKFKIDFEKCEDDNLNFSSEDFQEDDNKINNVIESKNKTETKGRAKFLCEECKKVFSSSKKLLDHVSEHGFDPAIVKPFSCDKCNSKFSTSSNLLQHKKYHVGKRTHICTFCGKGYITKSDLNTHEKQHLNKREYQCLNCPKTFNTHKDLRSHRLVVHTDPSLWNYVCTFCQKRFPIKSNADQHMRRHLGDKRFGCHICEKKFVDKVVMQKHIKSHSNFRAFKCEHCQKEYKDSKVLEIHLTKIHGIGNAKIPIRVKKHFCHVCPKSYFAKNKLTRHMFSHTGEKPYICHICERRFTDKSYVKQHLKTTHNVFDADENN